MRSCPSCQATYAGEEQTCAACGVSLVLVADEKTLSMSDTIENVAAVAAGGGGGGSPTPPPMVRANPTPGSSSQPGRATTETEGAPRSDAIVGSSLAGRYQVNRKIGEGGMGAVYEARHSKIGKRVAIKVLLDKYAQKADVVARLQQEARLASSIGHEHIVDITDFGETDDGRTFVVMEFLDGESLAQLLQRDGPLPPQRAVAIARQVASALGAAHGKGIVHRDVKPENVFITRRGDRDFVKVVDFGISKAMRQNEDDAPASSSPRLTQTGMVLGTPLYMSPEQARGEEELDHRIDVYALGVILYETLTGEVPFRGSNYLSIISQVLSQEPKAPSVVRPDLEISQALESVVMKAMAKDREVRYASMTEVDDDLRRIELGDNPITAARVALGKAVRRWPGAVVWTIGIAVVVAVAAFAVWKLMNGRPSTTVVRSELQPAITPPPAEPKPREFEKIKVHVTSEPSGAEVWWGNVKKGTTPTDIELPKKDTEITLTLKLDGYEEGEAKFFPTNDQDLPVTLQKKVETKPGIRKQPNKKTDKPPADKTDKTDKPPTDKTGGETKPNPYK